MKNRLALLVVAGGVLAGGLAHAKPVTLAVYGDWPYSDTLLAEAPQLISSINADSDVSLVLHVGDIHSGSMPCTDPWNQGIFNLFQQFQDPLVYTPGDNEWTDCHKAKEGSSGYPPAELTAIRQLFFPKPGYTLGLKPMRVLSQAQLPNFFHSTDAAFVENVIWEESQTVFVTLNVPGSNNDTVPWSGTFSNPAAQAQEVALRTAADLRWLELAFGAAELTGARAIVIGLQADMWDPAALATGGDGLSAYTPLVQKLADLTTAFGRPVLLLNGDSHVYETDRPLADPSSATGLIHGTQAVPNLTRITVEGSTPAKEWLKLTIDPRAAMPFSWQRVTYLP